jgi:hypothetical protein
LKRILKQVETAADIAADRFGQSPQLGECGVIEHQVVFHTDPPPKNFSASIATQRL